MPKQSLIVVCIFFIFTTSIAAQPDSLPIQSGQVIQGMITPETTTIRYRFTAEAGSSVLITMDSGQGSTLDPFLTLLGPENDVIVQNDDGGNQRNARIEAALERDGAYTIEASRYPQGESVGAFRLGLTLIDASGSPAAVDPLAAMPDFGVQPAPLEVAYQERRAGTLDNIVPQQYYAFVGQQGDLIRIIMTTTSGNLSPQINIANQAQISITSSVGQGRPTESIAYATIPETGWYLITAGRNSGIGGFNLFIDRLVTGAVVRAGEQVTGEFTPTAPTVSYVLRARIGDLVAVNLFTSDRMSAVQPRLCLLNVSFQALACGEGERFATVRATIPRSGAYILQATNLNTTASGAYNLRLTNAPVDVGKLPLTRIDYNEQRRGFINDNDPISYYRFTGKTGERVTLQMTTTSGDLDPFLILSDGELTEELVFNDNAGATPNARIVQYELKKDGEYIILATRAGLQIGSTTGGFDLSLTVGDLALERGAVAVRLTWQSAADLNLFVRGPDGRIVSSRNPAVTSGGRLQIDSNTDCLTLTDQPVEYIYWLPDALVPGDYEVWVWYQQTCGRTTPIEFDLSLGVGETLLNPTPQPTLPPLEIGERFVMSFRVIDASSGIIVDPGQVMIPSPQQTASEGGDALISYGEPIEADITDAVFAHFYQFFGEAGDQITIEVQTVDGSLDPIVILRDASDNTLPNAINDDADPNTRNARLRYRLPYQGQFIIAVTRFGVQDGVTSGRYRLTVTRNIGG
jgi:hypothetical protein